MFPVDYQVNVHTAKGVRRYVLLENQRDRALVVLPPRWVKPLLARLKWGGPQDDELVKILSREVLVIDRQRGYPLSETETRKALAASEHVAIVRAGLFRQKLPEQGHWGNEDDLGWAFGLEAARRRLGIGGGPGVSA
ncbi:MAG: hypothetical protein VKN33_04570 [Candidatus Sericytochromatia bacterium]|nr:hypothetical protein [Candidatus Sericytochromatia bacterium]